MTRFTAPDPCHLMILLLSWLTDRIGMGFLLFFSKTVKTLKRIC
jgi:hypothetical protein